VQSGINIGKPGSGVACARNLAAFRQQSHDSADESGEKKREARQDEPEVLAGGGEQRIDLIAS
jgi:hypothetical protein